MVAIRKTKFKPAFPACTGICTRLTPTACTIGSCRGKHIRRARERVEWTETRNVATNHGERAARIMAAESWRGGPSGSSWAKTVRGVLGRLWLWRELGGLQLRREVHEITGNRGSFRVNFRGNGIPDFQISARRRIGNVDLHPLPFPESQDAVRVHPALALWLGIRANLPNLGAKFLLLLFGEVPLST